jgi:protein-S-isoprenylcysteine O-methyltransferase Ste14
MKGRQMKSTVYTALTQREVSIMKAFGAIPEGQSAIQPGDAAPVASFSLLGRVAASLWFVVLTILFAKGLTAMIRALPPIDNLGSDNFALWATVVSRCCTLVFYLTLGWLILIRPHPLARREGIVPLAVSFIGTYGVWLAPIVLRPFLLEPGQVSPALEVASAAVTLLGSFSIILAVLHLGKSFSIAPQARKLVVGGPYRLVRHPLYVAEEIAFIGFLMQYAWYAALAYLILHMGFQIRRMLYEESLLRAVFPDYEAYARRTARLIPGIW